MGKFETAFGKWVIKNRWLLIFATIVIVFGSFTGTKHLAFNPDNRVFFSKDNPKLMALEALENTYTRSNTVMFVIAPKNGDIFTRETLSAVKELTEAAWQMPYSSRVNSISNFQHTEVDRDDLVVGDLVKDPATLTPDEIEAIKNIALSEPELVNYLVSQTGHVTGVFVNTILQGKSLAEVPEVVAFTRDLADRIKNKYPDIDMYLTGGVMIDNGFGEIGMDDMSTLIPLMFLVLVIFAGVSLRSFSGTIGTIFVILFSIITGTGLAGFLKLSMNAATASGPTIILTLAVADSIHIMATVYQQMRNGALKRNAIAESLRINLLPVFITSITTAIGFMTMVFSDAPPYRELGIMVAIGVMAAFFYSVLFLPALLAVLPLRARQKTQTKNNYLSKLANFVINQRRLLFTGLTILMIILTFGVTQLDLQDDWMRYFDKDYPIRADTDFAEENLTGFSTLEYSLGYGEAGGISDPDYLSKLDEFTSWFSKQQNVVHVSAISNTLKRLNQNMNGGSEEHYRTPQNRELAAQYLLLYEMSLPFGLDLNDRINVDKSASRVIVFVKGPTTKQLRILEEKGNAWLRNNAPEKMHAPATGLTVTWAHLSERNINSLLGGSFWALLLISGILIFAFRSFKLGLLSMIPNILPACIAFGIWGYLSGQAGLGIAVVAAMTLGIVVDDTVHFMSKYIRARKEHEMSSPDAIRYSFKTVGSAMVITTFVLVSGFMVLTLSGFRMNSDMGLLTAIAIITALALDFLYLPTLLMKIDSKTDLISIRLKEKNNEIKIGNLDAIPVNTTINSDGRDA